MLKNSDDNHNIQLYTNLLEQYGLSFESLNWGSKESQEIRFRILADIGIANGNSVLDIGSGLGDFYYWLTERKIKCIFTGIDITPKMYLASKQRFPKALWKNVSIENILEENSFDYVTASGLFAHRKNNPKLYFHYMIEKMYFIAKIGVAFNSLSIWKGEIDNNEFYADPIETLNFCKTLSKKIVFKHDYHKGDFTIYLYKR